MEKTYTQLYRIPGGLFLKGAPVFVAEGTLWQHKENGGLFACVNMKNIDPRTIGEVTVRFCPIATNGAVLGDGTMQTFAGLQAAPNEYFAAQELTALPEGSCAFGAAVIRVGFTDGSEWKAESSLAWHVADDGFNPQAPTQKK